MVHSMILMINNNMKTIRNCSNRTDTSSSTNTTKGSANTNTIGKHDCVSNASDKVSLNIIKNQLIRGTKRNNRESGISSGSLITKSTGKFKNITNSITRSTTTNCCDRDNTINNMNICC